MRRWASVAGRHGLLLLEVHSLTVSDTAQFMGEATSLHFDALQSWSGQMLVPAPHWQLALAHAGLLPDANLLCYPKDSLYTRITLQRLVPAPCAGFRLATLSDLPQLLELEAQWDSAFLRSSEATLRQRLELEPSGQFVAFGGDGALLAAMYTQRVASLAVLRKAVRRRSCGTEREWDGVGVGWSESGSGMPERNPRMRFCVLARGERPPARSG